MARNFLLLVCLSQALFCSEVFWFSYKIVTANSAVIYEEKNITSSMMILEKSKSSFLCALDLKYTPTLSKKQFLIQHFDTLLPCFYKKKSHLISWNENRQKESNDRVELIIEPIRFTVDFKEEFATISTIR